jgi:hypothetical protein
MGPQHSDSKAKQTGQVVRPLYSNILNTSRSSVKYVVSPLQRVYKHRQPSCCRQYDFFAVFVSLCQVIFRSAYTQLRKSKIHR